jgi:hypothetical protein
MYVWSQQTTLCRGSRLAVAVNLLHAAQLVQESQGPNGKRNFKACVKAFCGGKKKGTAGMPPGQVRHSLA